MADSSMNERDLAVGGGKKRQCEDKRVQFRPKILVILIGPPSLPANSYLTISCVVAVRQDSEFLEERG